MSTTTTATTSSPLPPPCSFCSTPQTSDTLHLNCPCFTAVYCNTTCQKKHWKIHAKNHKKAMKKMKMKKIQTNTTLSAPIDTTVDTTMMFILYNEQMQISQNFNFHTFTLYCL